MWVAFPFCLYNSVWSALNTDGFIRNRTLEMDSSFHVFMNILVTGFSLVVIGFHIMVTRVDYFYLNCNDDIVGNYC